MITHQMLDEISSNNNNSSSSQHTSKMNNNQHNHQNLYCSRERNKLQIFLLLIAIIICKCCAVTGESTEPPDCAGVVCDNLNCPSDSKVARIYGYDPINLVPHASDPVQQQQHLDDVVVASKRKRSIRSRSSANNNDHHIGHTIRHRRMVINDTMIAIQKCCECKCDFNKCPEFKCPATEYKIVEVQGSRVPGSCCTKYVCTTQKPTCYSHNLGQHFNPSDQWKDDACTQCECSETGETNCETPICKPLSCEKKHTVDGECCPVCDISDSKFCEPDVECDRHCRNGYEYDPVRKCAICACAKSTNSKIATSTESDGVLNGTIDAITTKSTATESASTTKTTTPPPPPPPPTTTAKAVELQPSVWNTDVIDNTNASSTKPINDDDTWYVHLPIVLGICITIGAFAIILSLTCRHISHKKDKHHLNRKQNTPLI